MRKHKWSGNFFNFSDNWIVEVTKQRYYYNYKHVFLNNGFWMIFCNSYSSTAKSSALFE